MSYSLQPAPLTPIHGLFDRLREQGFAVLSAADVSRLSSVSAQALAALQPSWDDLPVDLYLKDGGRYRRRRHASVALRGEQVQVVPHRAHWQPVSYNALHGGMQRWFEPVSDAVLSAPALQGLLRGLAGVASRLQGDQTWFTEVHQFRIDTSDGIGRPTPEGAHRDGVNWVAVLLIARQSIKGGETRVFDIDSPRGQRFTLSEPWSLLLLDDQRVIHETTPIQPMAEAGWRDTLVVTLRAGGFLADPTSAAAQPFKTGAEN